jgi:hypothetical protein
MAISSIDAPCKIESCQQATPDDVPNMSIKELGLTLLLSESYEMQSAALAELVHRAQGKPIRITIPGEGEIIVDADGNIETVPHN